MSRIHECLHYAGKSTDDKVASTPEIHHTIGKSQNISESFPAFLQQHAGDPAAKYLACHLITDLATTDSMHN